MSDANDSDDASQHPWDTNRSRMRDELKTASYKLTDALAKKLPSQFTTAHGLFLRETVFALAAGVDEPARLDALRKLSRLAVCSSCASLSSSPAPLLAQDGAPPQSTIGRGPRSDFEVLKATLEKVRAERDEYAKAVALAETSVAQLKAANSSTVRAPSVPDASSLAKVDALRDRATQLGKQVTELEGENDGLRALLQKYRVSGTPELFKEYVLMGTPTSLRERDALGQVTRCAFEETDKIAASYEATLGALLCGFDRRSRQLDAVFQAVAGPNARQLPTRASVLSTVINELAAEGIKATEPADALHQVAVAAVKTPPRLATLALANLPSLESLVERVRSRVPDDRQLRDLLLGSTTATDIKETYASLLATRLSTDGPSRAADRRRGRLLVVDDDDDECDSLRSVTGHDEGTIQREETNSTVSSRAEDVGRGGGRLRIAQAKAGVDSGRPANLTKEDFTRRRELARERMQKLIAEAKAKRVVAWPQGPPSNPPFPFTMKWMRMFPWCLGLLESEQLTPTKFEYKHCAGDRGGQTFVTLEKAEALYDTEPWRAIAVPLEPVSFDPVDPRFSAFYQNAKLLYAKRCKVLWERCHFILLPPSVNRSKTEYSDIELANSKWSGRRTHRNSDFTSEWLAHLQQILAFLHDGVVDIDFILDPFLYWPPAFGVSLVIPSTGQSLEACIQELDRLQPDRVYFSTSTTRLQHPAYGSSGDAAARSRIYDRLKQKFFPTSARSPAATASRPLVKRPVRADHDVHSDSDDVEVLHVKPPATQTGVNGDSDDGSSNDGSTRTATRSSTNRRAPAKRNAPETREPAPPAAKRSSTASTVSTQASRSQKVRPPTRTRSRSPSPDYS